MVLSLARYSAQETGYISKFNSDNVLVENAINSLQAGGTTPTSAAGGTPLNDVWDRSGLVGISSFQITSATAQTLSATSGTAWILATQTRGRTVGGQTLNFAALTSGIYSIQADAAGALSVSAASATIAPSKVELFQVQYNAPTFESATRTAPILLHGDDYARMLSGAIFGSFTRVADRLSAIEGALTLDSLYAQESINDNAWYYKAGQFRNNNLITSTPASSIALGFSNAHYIEVAISDGSISYALSSWTASEAIPLRFISTCSGTVCDNNDARTWALAWVSGGAGTGGLVNSGTTDGLWQLYRGTGPASSPVSDAVIAVDRGVEATASIRWNETLDRWQFTADGSTYTDLGGLGTLDLGGGQVPRIVMTLSAPAVLAAQGLSTSGTPVLISLSAYTSTTTTAALIRGTAFDSALSALGTSAEPFPGVAFYRDSSTVVAGAAAKIVADWASGRPEQPQMIWVPVTSQTVQYVLWAASTASLKVSAYLIAYQDVIQGVGTQLVSATVAGLTGPISTASHVLSSSQFSAVGNRVQVFYLEISSTLPGGSLYDVEFYGSHGGTASQLLFQARNIDASTAYITRLGWFHRDLASTNQMYLRLSHQAASAGLFSIALHGERYA